MFPPKPITLMLIGVLLMVLSFLAIFGMVLRLVEPSFLVSFLAYGGSFAGLLIGLVGILNYQTNPRDE